MMPAPLTVPAPAKVNLFLHVNGRRPDGYHELQTLFQLLDFGDTLTFTPRGDLAVERVTDLAGVPAEADLVIRAARALLGDNTPPFGVDIAVTKRLPQGGGLGGGSSDAASTLCALNQLWGLGLSTDELARRGLALGADVPVFVRGETAFAEGVGEHLVPLPQPERWFVVTHPGCVTSTAEVFCDPALTRSTPRITIAALDFGATHNDCEPVARRRHPEIDEAFAWFAAHGAAARMTGTGASVFAALDDEAAARALAAQAPPAWTTFVAKGVNRSPLHAALEGAAA